MKYIIKLTCFLVTSSLFVGCNNQVLLGTRMASADIQSFLDKVERCEAIEEKWPSGDELYRVIDNELSKNEWQNASQALLLLHYTQINLMSKALTQGDRALAMTFKGLYDYEMNFIVPLFYKYSYPKDAISFYGPKILTYVNRKLESHLECCILDLVKELYTYLECVQKYCWYVNTYQRYPSDLSDLFNDKEHGSSISLEDDKLICHAWSFYLAQPSADMPPKLVKLLNSKIIQGKERDSISCNIKRLELNNVSTKELAYIFSFLRQVERLFVENSNIDFAQIDVPSGLRHLMIYNSKVSNLGSISSKDKITYLSLSWCKVDDFSALSDYISLEGGLFLSSSNICDLPPLGKLAKLERIDADRTRISSLRNISEVRSLKRLKLSYTPLKELSGLEKLSNLEHLDISGTKVKHIPPLPELKHIKYFNLLDTAIPEADVKMLNAAHPDKFLCIR